MNDQAFRQICALLDSKGVEYQVFKHPECRTSEESSRVRKEAGMPEAIGAKALVVKLTLRGGGSEFAVFVLPGTHSLDKLKLKEGLPELKEFRFATPEELFDLAGVVPGCMPPFGKQIFGKTLDGHHLNNLDDAHLNKISRLYVSSALNNFERVAFNAASLTTSITLLREDYFKIIEADKVWEFSKAK